MKSISYIGRGDEGRDDGHVSNGDGLRTRDGGDSGSGNRGLGELGEDLGDTADR